MDDACVVTDVWKYAWGVFLLGCGVGILLAMAMVVLVAWWYLAPKWETTPSSNTRHWAGDARRLDDDVVEESAEQCLSTTGVKIAWWDEELDQDVQESPETTSLSLQGNKLHVGTAQYVLLGCKVRLAPRAKKRGPWWPRAPILINFPSVHECTSEHTKDVAEQSTEEIADREESDEDKPECRDPAKYPTTCLALFLDTPNRKERWYTHLRLASGQVPRAFAVEEEFLGFSGCMWGQSSTYALKSRKRLSGGEENQKQDGSSGEVEDHAASNAPEVGDLQANIQKGATWVDVEDKFANDAETALNLMLARLYFDATRSQKCRSVMRAKMQRKLSRLAMPDWLAPLRVVDLRFPRVPPRFTQVKVIHRVNGNDRKMGVDAFDDGEPTWRLGAWVEAEPGTVVTVETSVDWRRSSKEKKEGSTRSDSSVKGTGSEEPKKKVLGGGPGQTVSQHRCIESLYVWSSR
uniref:SMP-LTD domain-containing protein n=1 Tax=Picocystis salinarum TaxID=88271 RepID=A0A6U9S6C1_9CHLO